MLMTLTWMPSSVHPGTLLSLTPGSACTLADAVSPLTWSVMPCVSRAQTERVWVLRCRKYAQEEAAQVFITDTLLTTLMCTPRSVYSWDIVITRAGGRLFFDKRDGSSLDLLTVAETSPEQIAEDKDNINGVQQLSLEATTLNQNFSQQVQRCHLCLSLTALTRWHELFVMPACRQSLGLIAPL